MGSHNNNDNGTINKYQSLRAEADQWRRGTDTMDVWFDSGSSWAGVAKARKELTYPADLYLEGEIIQEERGGRNAAAAGWLVVGG